MWPQQLSVMRRAYVQGKSHQSRIQSHRRVYESSPDTMVSHEKPVKQSKQKKQESEKKRKQNTWLSTLIMNKSVISTLLCTEFHALTERRDEWMNE